MIMSSPHLTPGHAKVCGGKVSAEEAITEAPGDVGVSANQWEASILDHSPMRGEYYYLVTAPGLRAVQTTELRNQPMVWNENCEEN